MTATIIDGIALAEKIKKKIIRDLHAYVERFSCVPCLAAVVVGDDQISKIYVDNKRKKFDEIGMFFVEYKLGATIAQEELLSIIKKLNVDDSIDGILVQLPLPKHINSDEIFSSIDPNKDVDGFHPYNQGKMILGLSGLRPCTAKGVMTILDSIENDFGSLIGKRAVVIGSSRTIGKPIALELMNANCTVSVCNVHTKNIAEYIREADLVVSAAGVSQLIKGEWIKEGTVVIDVGINRRQVPMGADEIHDNYFDVDGNVATAGVKCAQHERTAVIGDVDFESAKRRAGWITPVPGGVGPMTVISLAENTLTAAWKMKGF